MFLLWDLYWPALAAAVVIGVVAGYFAYRPGTRRGRRLLAMLAGALVALATTALWHGPLGAAQRLVRTAEPTARWTLDYYELGQVQATLERGPLSRQLLLSGPTDSFQRSELVRILGDVPGVATVYWPESGAGATYPLPLLAEVELAALLALALGIMLAYLIELRRRARAEWRW